MGVVVVAALGLSATAFAATWNTGDVIVGVSSGNYNVYSSAGVLKETVNGGSSYTTGCAFNNDQTKLFGTFFGNGNVVTFDTASPHTSSTFASGISSPESVVFDQLGNVYVSSVGGTGIRKYDSTGTLLHTYTVGTRVDWIDLSADQASIFFTQENNNIFKLDLATDTYSVWGTDAGNNFAALRILPDGGVLSAGQNNSITRFNAAGTPIQHYDDAANSAWFALNLDPNGTSFWSADDGTSNVVKFNIATGAEEASFNTGTGGGTVFGVCLKGEITVGGGDTTPPRCELTSTITGPPKQIQVTVQDTGSGLQSVTSTTTNAVATVPVFAPGDTSAQVVTATKTDQSSGSTLALTVTDVAGNVTKCDPLWPGVSARTRAGSKHTFTSRHSALGAPVAKEV
ncbi:MAG: YncE family protein [Gaiellaceae bacterium]